MLNVSIGPVQDFIAQARSTSDLWAGSHLLSCLSWQAMRVICEEFGPEQIIQPQLKGVAIVDAWLVEQGLPTQWFEQQDWREQATDANPLFTAAVPNRFSALVPAAQAEKLAETITARVREWVLEEGKAALAELLDAAGEAENPDLYCHTQLEAQLKGFPEIHWSVAPFGLIRGTKTIESHAQLESLLGVYHDARPPGIFGHPSWRAIDKASQGDIEACAHVLPQPGQPLCRPC